MFPYPVSCILLPEKKEDRAQAKEQSRVLHSTTTLLAATSNPLRCHTASGVMMLSRASMRRICLSVSSKSRTLFAAIRSCLEDLGTTACRCIDATLIDQPATTYIYGMLGFANIQSSRSHGLHGTPTNIRSGAVRGILDKVPMSLCCKGPANMPYPHHKVKAAAFPCCSLLVTVQFSLSYQAPFTRTYAHLTVPKISCDKTQVQISDLSQVLNHMIYAGSGQDLSIWLPDLNLSVDRRYPKH